jgi:hypothetical protein
MKVWRFGRHLSAGISHLAVGGAIAGWLLLAAPVAADTLVGSYEVDDGTIGL